MKQISHFFKLVALLLYVSTALAQSARVQLIHNCADAAAQTVDVYINGDKIYDDFAFRTATAFADVPSNILIAVDIAPGNSSSVAESIYNTVVTFDANQTYVIVANGLINSSAYSPFRPFELSVYNQGRESSSMAGNTDILVCHGGTDAPTVDIVHTTFLPINTVVDNISYPFFSNGYVELPTGNYTIDVTNQTGGTVISSYDVKLLDLGLQDQAITVVASGFLNPTYNNNGPSFGLWVALPSGGNLIPLPQSPYARVQIIHNSADAAASLVDVYIDGDLALDDFAFRTATPWLDLRAGQPVSIDIAPSNSISSAESIYNLTTSLNIGSEYVIVADGIVSPTGYTPNQPFQLSVYDQGREVAYDGNNTDILIHHGSTDAPTVDIVETSVPAGTIVNDLSYGDFTNNYLELPTADYLIDVRDASGTNTVATFQAPLSSLALDGKALVVVASGFLNPTANSNGPEFGLWVATHSGGNLIPLPIVPPAPTARVQIIHNSADAAAEFVDVYINGDLALNNFKFRTATPFIDAPAGVPVQIDIAPATSSSVSESIFNTTVTLTANEKYVVVASGIVSPSGYTPSQSFGLSVFTPAREIASNANNTDVLLYHGATDAPTVDVVETSVPAGTVVDDLSYGDFTANFLELPTADYTLDVRDASGTVVVATYAAPLQTLGLQGQSLTVVASGFLNPDNNSNGAAFGLWVALPSGGDLIPLPLVTLSNDDFSASQVVLYPNPAADNINLKIPFGYETISGKITDMSGRVVKNITNAQNTIDVSNLSDGMYVVDLEIDNYSLQKKIVIKK
ncbi:DUF4397 domain-containing protein [Flavobacterium sp. CYK-55]|uniref:T9SS type A sorting domain-containing protein n=1 Tax=Flavobacterium sp. CYK-55 TaxID=2835529 RepID=UPI001BCE15A3|nr:DUF4397 domain-containing protein [Flavobacterium sp. CYK-55]MBS7786792.1 DUF4397 domain-containing protein [Flavobacterium sp. CYK-55]